MADSILNDTKKALGLEADYEPFDSEIILHINSVFADLNQLGVGPDQGYFITSEEDTWDELLGEDLRYNSVKTYLYLRVRMLFDPPTLGYLVTAMEKMIEKAEWRITVAADEIKNPPPVDSQVEIDTVETVEF